VQSHYLAHGCFLGTRLLLARCADVPRVPTLLLHGRADRVCRPEAAEQLHHALPGSRLQWLDNVGHDAAHPSMLAAMAQALGHYAAHARFDANTALA
jgi:proline iminopeptidase